MHMATGAIGVSRIAPHGFYLAEYASLFCPTQTGKTQSLGCHAAHYAKLIMRPTRVRLRLTALRSEAEYGLSAGSHPGFRWRSIRVTLADFYGLPADKQIAEIGNRH